MLLRVIGAAAFLPTFVVVGCSFVVVARSAIASPFRATRASYLTTQGRAPYRAQALGTELRFDSKPGGPTLVGFSLPRPADERGAHRAAETYVPTVAAATAAAPASLATTSSADVNPAAVVEGMLLQAETLTHWERAIKAGGAIYLETAKVRERTHSPERPFFLPFRLQTAKANERTRSLSGASFLPSRSAQRRGVFTARDDRSIAPPDRPGLRDARGARRSPRDSRRRRLRGAQAVQGGRLHRAWQV